MFLVFKPDEGDEQRYPYNPHRMMSPEMEAIEKVTGRNWGQFTVDVVQGSALCRRALLWVLQKRKHPTLRFADVEFSWEQVVLEFSWEEYQGMIDKTVEKMGGDAAETVEALKMEQLTAFRESEDEDHGGKARLPIAG